MAPELDVGISAEITELHHQVGEGDVGRDRDDASEAADVPEKAVGAARKDLAAIAAEEFDIVVRS